MKASAPSIAPVLNTYVCDCAGRITTGVCPCERTVVVIDPVVPGGTAQRVKQVRIPKTRHVVLGRRIDRRKGHYVQDGLGIVREGDRPVIGRYTPEPLEHALSRNQIAESPLKRIAKRERPKQKAKPRRRLSDEECAKLIEHSLATYRALNATYAFTGMRQSEPLGLTWEDIDFESERICVRYQLARKKRGEPVRRVSLKSDNGVREIELLPELASMLKRHKADAFARRQAGSSNFVFCTESGQAHYFRNVAARGIDKAADAAGLNREGLPKGRRIR